MTYIPPAPPTSSGSSNSRVIRLTVAVVGLIAIAALVVGIIALTRSGSSSAADTDTSIEPTYTAGEITEATKLVCATWSVADESVVRATTRPAADEQMPTIRANARAAMSSAAALLDAAASRELAAKPEVLAAAHAVAETFRQRVVFAMIGSEDPRFTVAVDESEAAQAEMSRVCGGG